MIMAGHILQARTCRLGLFMDLINVSHLSHRLRDGGLFDISFGVAAGERFAIFGPPAAGKSLLLTALAGRLQPDAGGVTIRGRAARDCLTAIGFAPQAFTLKPSATPRRLILSSLASHHIPAAQRAARLAESLHVSGLAGRADQPITELNHTALLSLNMAAAIAHRPEVILLDDTIRLLSKDQRDRWWDYFVDRCHLDGAAIIYATMASPEAESADRVLLLNEGRALACEKPSSLLEQCAMEEIVVEAADVESIETTLRGIPQVEAVSTASGLRFRTPSGSAVAAHLFRHPIEQLRAVFVRRSDLWDCLRTLSAVDRY